jgi:cytochrome c oxidase assembly protein subunit 15
VLLRRLALASVVANSVIVVTGGAVRLTSSGLGCPTWPRCTESTFTPTEEYAVHGVIEFGNRLLTFVLLAVVVALLVVALRQGTRRAKRLAVLGFLGIPAQAVLGGITVLTGLNPWTVMGHFLVSAVLIGLAVLLHDEVRAEPRPPVTPLLRRSADALLGLTAAVVVVGTVVTGSGPHSGDALATRTGLDPGGVAQLHADLVMLLVGATVGLWVALRATGASAPATRAVTVLLGVETAQAAVGFTQHLLDLPVALVAVHLAGSCVTVVAAVRLSLATRERGGQPLTAAMRAATAPAYASAAPSANPRNSEGSVTSSSSSSGPSGPGTMSTRA